MTQRDYILRLIERFGQLLIALRNRILDGDLSRAELEAELAGAVNSTGLDLSLVHALTPESLVEMIAPDGDMEPGRAWLVAETLYLDGLQSALEGRPDDARSAWERAVPLYEVLTPHGIIVAGLPEAEERLAEIRERTASLDGGDPGP